MRITKVVVTFVVLLVFAFINVDLALSQDDQELDEMTVDEELEQELKWLQAETYVITASKVMEKIEKAPASITVINDRQIKQMGAKHLHDVINREVPSYSSVLALPRVYRPYVRGRGSRVFMMINSQPIYDVFTQGVNLFGYDTLPMDNVKRIEFVRGPGSALYGSGAYDGVINVITKGAEDIDGIELSARGGSWDTQQYNLLFGRTLSDLEVVLNFNYFKTHGHRALIEEDYQTMVDRDIHPLYGLPPISLAPGHTLSADERYDLALNLKFKGFTLDGRYVDRDRDVPFNYGTETYTIGYMSLTERMRVLIEDYYLNLKYETNIRDGLDLSVKGYRQQLNWTPDWQYIPPGANTLPVLNPTPPPETIFAVWPEGVLSGASLKSYHMGVEIQSTYKIHDSMAIVAGATYEKQDIPNSKGWANFLPSDTPGVLIQLPSKQLISEGGGLAKWNYIAFFLEDIWDITRNIRLTTGLRYDEYYDFELHKSPGYEGTEGLLNDLPGHFSPRAGLTWEFLEGYDLKLLYGHAFLIPNILVYINFPGTEIEPQTVDTYEISLGAEFTSSLKGRITLYQREERGFHVFEAGGLTNRGESRSRGVEVEARYNLGRGTYLAGSYSYSSWPDVTGNYWPDVNIPEYVGKIMANIRLSRHLNLYADCQHFGAMSRQPGDLRDNTSDYTFVNATLTARKFLKCCEGLELRASVYNLFDEDWSQFVDEAIPYGWPQPGRNFLLEVKYSF